MYAYLNLCLHIVLLQTAFCYPCGDYILAYIPVEDFLAAMKIEGIPLPNAPGLMNVDSPIIDGGAAFDGGWPVAGGMGFGGPLHAKGKVNIVGGGCGGFNSHSFPNLGRYPSPPVMPTLPYPMLPIVYLQIPMDVLLKKIKPLAKIQPYIEAISTLTPVEPIHEIFINTVPATNTDIEEDVPVAIEQEDTEVTEDNVLIAPSLESTETIVEITTALNTIEPTVQVVPEIVYADPIIPLINLDIPIIDTEIPIIDTDLNIPDVPEVDFDKILHIPDFEDPTTEIAAKVQENMKSVEAKIDKIIALVMGDDLVLETPIEIEDGSGLEVNSKEIVLPIAGTAGFGGFIPASGSVKIVGTF